MSEQALQFGLMTPVVRLNPKRSTAWQIDGGAEEIRQIAVAADALGFHHLDCAEHVGIPAAVGKDRGERYYDPLATLSYMAALTMRIRLLTHVLVLPYHHPLAVAKRYGTLDRLSGGRLILGIGVGSLKPEFELLGAEFERRGEIYSEALAALRSSLGRREPVFEGRYFRYSGFVIDPHSIQQPVPMWLGGNSRISLRRALTAGDGWAPFGMELPALSALLAEARSWPESKERTQTFDVALAPQTSYEISEPQGLDALVEQIVAYRSAGATVIDLYFPSRSLAHYLEQLAIFAERVAPRFR
jgi:probable F420-dependent oxidoreductase